MQNYDVSILDSACALSNAVHGRQFGHRVRIALHHTWQIDSETVLIVWNCQKDIPIQVGVTNNVISQCTANALDYANGIPEYDLPLSLST